MSMEVVMTGKNETKKVVRDAGTGKFVKPPEAEKRPKTTVTETVNLPKRKR